MAQNSTKIRRKQQIALLLVLLVALSLRVWLATKVVPDGLFDDAYITLRYARNLIHGKGFVYNPSERVWGTTTPLFTLLLSGVGYIVEGASRLEMLAVLFGILASVGAFVLTAQAFWSAGLQGIVVWIYLLSFALLPSFVTNSVSGMETSLVLFLMAWSLLYYVRGQWALLGGVAGLLLLTRIDTAIWLAVLATHAVAERRVNPRGVGKAIGVFLLLTLPWFLFAFFYFGTVIPQSVVGKAVSHGSFQPVDGDYALRFLRSYFPVPFLGHQGWIVVCLGLLVIAIGVWRVWARYTPLRPLGTFFALYNLAFLLSRVPLFSWYFPPAEWVFYLLLILGLQAMWIILSRVCGLKASGIVERVAWIALGGLLIAYSGRGLIPHLLAPPEANIWTEISTFLNDHTAPEARVFLEHIGLVGFGDV